MTSPFKFLRRVRIHGGECGAVARALHHKVKGSSLYQADSGKALESTNERKQMSTKTTLKRIALVAVSALAGGLFTIVSTPVASAAGNNELATSISVGTIPASRAGLTVNVPIVLNLPSTTASGDTVVVSTRVLSCPATSTYCDVTANPTQSAYSAGANTSGARINWATAASGSGSFGDFEFANSWSTSGNATATATYQVGANDSTGQITLRVAFTPDVSGSYTILVSTPNAVADVIGTPAAGTAYYSASTADTSTSFTVTTSATTTTLALSAVTPAPAALATGAPGQIIKVALESPLGSSETVTITTTGSATLGDLTTTSAHTATTYVITSSICTGVNCYFRVDNTVGETVTVTATGSGTLSSSLTGNLGVVFTLSDSSKPGWTAAKGYLATDFVAATTSTTPTLAQAITSSGVTGDYNYLVSTTDSSHALVVRNTTVNTAAEKSHWTVTDVFAKITGTVANAVYTVPVSFSATAAAATSTCSDGCATTTISAALLRTGVSSFGATNYQSFNAVLRASTDVSIGVTASPAVATTITATNSARRVATGSSNTIVFTLEDQYEAAISNTSVTITVAGRNGATASTTLVTNSDGEVSYSLTDTGTVGATDTITATVDSVTGSATLTYGTTTVTTLSVYTAPHVSAGVADTNILYADKKDIDASSKAGASATTQTVTVLAKDANAVVMSGVPVTFTIAGTGCGLLSTKELVYTGADGYASTSIYAWLEGKCTVTATAGGQTVTTDAYFVQTGTGEARTISAAVSGGMVTATVKDRFGNPIKGVYVYATRTGEGYFGNGSSSTSGITGEAGTVEFYLNGNTSATSVKVQLGDSSAASDEFGQSSADSGKYGTKSATQTAFTAYAAGTTTTAETGVGSSLAPAGINSATVTVAAAANAAAAAAEAATDAAAEAIDAANAATDAANLAAEAADAATVAAEEARDAADAATAAVEELATQVATLMAALKAQITTLANTVAKIAKKVKA